MFSTTTPWCKSKHSKWGQLGDLFWTFLSSDANFQRDTLGWELLSLSPRVGWNLSAFRGLPQLLVSAQGMEDFFRMMASWWEVFIQLKKILWPKHTLLRNTECTAWKKKKKPKSPQALPRTSDITFSKAVGSFYFILRPFLQNVQNKSSTDGCTGEGSFVGQCLWRLEVLTSQLTTGRAALACSPKVCLCIGILDCSPL